MDFLTNDDLSLTSRQKKYNEYHKTMFHSLLMDASKGVTSPRIHSDEEEMEARYKLAVQLEAKEGTLCVGFIKVAF